MWPDRVSNPGPPTYESGALPIALRGPAVGLIKPPNKYLVDEQSKHFFLFLWQMQLSGQFNRVSF